MVISIRCCSTWASRRLVVSQQRPGIDGKHWVRRKSRGSRCSQIVRLLSPYNNTLFRHPTLSDHFTPISYNAFPHPVLIEGDIQNDVTGSVRVKKTKKNWPPPKLIFCHKLSPLDWIMVIWAIFGLPGPSGGSGGPMWGLGGPAGIKFTNFHMWLFLALRCHFLDLTSF